MRWLDDVSGANSSQPSPQPDHPGPLAGLLPSSASVYTMYTQHPTARAGESAMRATICKWGNSLGLRIPRGLAEDAGLAEVSVLELRLEDGRLVAEPVMVEKLDVVLGKVTSKNRHHELLVDSPLGREVW